MTEPAFGFGLSIGLFFGALSAILFGCVFLIWWCE